MAYGDFKDLKRITIADKASRDKAFNIAENIKHDEYQRAFASLFHKSFDKKTLVGTVKSEVICYKELAEELSKPSTRKFEKRNVHSPFMDNMWGAKLNGFRFFLCVIDVYRKCA